MYVDDKDTFYHPHITSIQSAPVQYQLYTKRLAHSTGQSWALETFLATSVNAPSFSGFCGTHARKLYVFGVKMDFRNKYSLLIQTHPFNCALPPILTYCPFKYISCYITFFHAPLQRYCYNGKLWYRDNAEDGGRVGILVLLYCKIPLYF